MLKVINKNTDVNKHLGLGCISWTHSERLGELVFLSFDDLSLYNGCYLLHISVVDLKNGPIMTLPVQPNI